MSELFIRPAEAQDIPALDRLLLQVHRVHSNARPDLFRAGAKKYIDDLCVDETARGGYNVTLNVLAGNDSAICFYKAIGMRVQKIGMETIL